ncbi:MAG TPA: hypothetical protein VH681_13985 [Nitrospiraceae bacterium]|jgi:hypothetical protein
MLKPLSAAAAVMSFFLAGCSVRLTDATPDSFALSDTTPGVGNERRSRDFQLEVDREPLVFERSIQPTATINGVDHAMTRQAGNTWSVRIPEYDPQQPERLPPGYDIAYRVRYQYLPLPIPIPFTATKRLPTQGTIFVDVTPDVFAERDDPLFFDTATDRKEVRVYNLSNAPLQITAAEIQGTTPCFGDGSGQAFAIEDPPSGSRLPTLQPGESITYRMQFLGFTLACGKLVVETDHQGFPTLEFPLLGRIFF